MLKVEYELPDELRLEFQCSRDLEKAYFYILDKFPSSVKRDWMLGAYSDWQDEVGVTTWYHKAMWAATNRDLLQEWVLNFIIEQEWA